MTIDAGLAGPGDGQGDAAAVSAGEAVERAWQTVRKMVLPGGCAWHAEQTHASLLPFLTEEAAEFTDAVDRQLPAAAQAEELGDVLYQVLVHAAVAERDGEGYGLADVAARQDAKLRARHPHVFGELGHMSAAELEREWEHLKEAAAGEQRGSRGVFEGIPTAMPTLAKAQKMLSRLSRAGIDPAALLSHTPAPAWPEDAAGSVAAPPQGTSARQEEAASRYAQTEQSTGAAGAGDAATRQLGEQLLALVWQAQEHGINADAALRHTLNCLRAALPSHSGQ